MATATFQTRKQELETYFDRTASEAWAKLTSDVKVSGVRARVRAGRDAMRANLLSWLPEDLSGRRILDAGCGAGQLAAELARRGGDVVAIDIAGTLVGLAQERYGEESFAGRIDFRVGDMTDPSLGEFDHMIAMDSLIHYGADDIVKAAKGVLERTRVSAAFTFVPRTPLLDVLLGVGQLFPRSDRSPAVKPVGADALARLFERDLGKDWSLAQTRRITSGFYVSQAMELVRA